MHKEIFESNDHIHLIAPTGAGLTNLVVKLLLKIDRIPQNHNYQKNDPIANLKFLLESSITEYIFVYASSASRDQFMRNIFKMEKEFKTNLVSRVRFIYVKDPNFFKKLKSLYIKKEFNYIIFEESHKTFIQDPFKRIYCKALHKYNQWRKELKLFKKENTSLKACLWLNREKNLEALDYPKDMIITYDVLMEMVS